MADIINFVHVSDLHYRTGWPEEIGEVEKAFFDDLKMQIKNLDNPYLIFSGDLVQSGGDQSLYNSLKKEFVSKLNRLGFDKSKLIFVPGNHDVDQSAVSQEIPLHNDFRNYKPSESAINNYLAENPEFSRKKFSNYLMFAEDITEHSLNSDQMNGKGFLLDNEVGIYLLNTAIFSSGGVKDPGGSFKDPFVASNTGFDSGVKDPDGREIPDYGYLHVDTREMMNWLNHNDLKYKILVMHHPIGWLSENMRTRMGGIINNYFDIVLHGHTHDQNISSYHSVDGSSLVLSSPPLFTRRDGKSAYSLVKLTANKDVSVTYRAWSGKSNFVPGVQLTNAETGTINISLSTLKSPPSNQLHDDISSDFVGEILEGYIDKAVSYFDNDNQFWVEPDIASAPETAKKDENLKTISCTEFASDFKTTILRAPPQFGLSTLGSYFAKSYWEQQKEKLPVLIDSDACKNYDRAITRFVKALPEVKVAGNLPIGLIILDNFSETDSQKIRQANEISKAYPDATLVILSRSEEINFGENSLIGQLKFQFETRYIWSLQRAQIRILVTQFLQTNTGFDEDQTVDYIVSQFTNLNLHRTAHNTILLFTILQNQADSDPVNRIEMIKKFLHIKFSKIQSVPKYNTLPDLEDCLYVMGNFVEKLAEINKFEFEEKFFMRTAIEYCDQKGLAIEVNVLFNCLVDAGVLICRDKKYSFQFTYWLYFFMAHRMHKEESFFDYILRGDKYSRYPEVIEYYSGIDRQASGLINYLANDLSTENKAFMDRSQFKPEFDPALGLSWEPQEDQISETLRLVKDEVEHSKLPKEIKDAAADRNFDRSLPYDQKVKEFIKDSSLALCIQKMKASARALRNSDYAEIEGKKRLFSEVMATMTSEMHLVAILAPILSETGRLSFEGMGYFLNESFDDYDNEDDKIIAILRSIPFNMANRYLDDVYSPKMTPILYDYIKNTKSEQEKALLIWFIIHKKPEDWEEITKEYIYSLNRDSFYLYILAHHVLGDYEFGFNKSVNVQKLRTLTGIIYGYHHTKARRVNLKTIKEFANKMLGKKQ